MRVYLSGPMSGIDGHNFPAFNDAADYLRKQGHYVFNPAESEKRATYKDYMKEDITWILHNAEAIALLPGWRSSKGAFAEWALATALGLEIMYVYCC